MSLKNLTPIVKTTQTAKNIKVGHFYFIHDQSLVGHPGYIIWVNDEKNLYLAIKFGSTPNEHNVPFGRAIGKGIEQSYFYKRSFLGKRKDFSKRELNDMYISKDELSKILSYINVENPIYSKNINRKDKRTYKWLFKQ